MVAGAAVKVPDTARTVSNTTAGTINPDTKKPYLDDCYKPRTIRQSNSVIRSVCMPVLTGPAPLLQPGSGEPGHRP